VHLFPPFALVLSTAELQRHGPYTAGKFTFALLTFGFRFCTLLPALQALLERDPVEANVWSVDA
jgi:dipeptide/tripeptide permease